MIFWLSDSAQILTGPRMMLGTTSKKFWYKNIFWKKVTVDFPNGFSRRNLCYKTLANCIGFRPKIFIISKHASKISLDTFSIKSVYNSIQEPSCHCTCWILTPPYPGEISQNWKSRNWWKYIDFLCFPL